MTVTTNDVTDQEQEVCQDCGCTDDDVIDGLCESCEEKYDMHCWICKEWYRVSDFNACRHVFLNESCEAAGAGSDYNYANEACKESFFAVLKKTRLAHELRNALVSKRYWLQFYGSIFGHDGLHCKLDGVDYGDRFTLNLTEKERETLSDGVLWLMSLWSGVHIYTSAPNWPEGATPDADNMTIEWIDEYLEMTARDAEGAD